MDPNETKKTTPVLAGNRPNYVEQGLELSEQPNRIIAPIYHENFARTIMCVAILQILKSDILFWPISLDEVAEIKEECKHHPDWYLMDLDNSVEKLIAKTWKFFTEDYIINAASASKIALTLGRAIDRECSTVNSVFVNMLHSGYDAIVKSGVIYGAVGYAGGLHLKHQTDDIDVVRQLVSEKVLEFAEHITPMVAHYIEDINSDFVVTERVRDMMVYAKQKYEDFIVPADFYPIDGEVLRLLRHDKAINWVIQPEPEERFKHRAGGHRHYFIFPVFNMGMIDPLKAMNRKNFIEWAEKNPHIIYANPDTREGIEVDSLEAANEIIAALAIKNGGET